MYIFIIMHTYKCKIFVGDTNYGNFKDYNKYKINIKIV